MYKINVLEKYKNESDSNSCYLDGRYFNLVFQDYPGLIIHPLFIDINDKITVQMIDTTFNIKYTNLLRVIITTKEIRHALLVIINHMDKIVFIYDPDVHQNLELHTLVVDEIKTFLSHKLTYHKKYDELTSNQHLYYQYKDIITSPIYTNQHDCTKYGLCNALVIKYAYNVLNDKHLTKNDVLYIKKFMNAIEKHFKLPAGKPDIEYNWAMQQSVGLGGI